MLESLFGRFFRSADKLPKRAPDPKPVRPEQTSSKTGIEFEKTLKAIAQQRDLVVAGNLHVLNVAKIKEKVGERWPRLQSLIKMNIEGIINSHLGPKDIMLNHSELNYVVIFPNDSQDVAARKLSDISRQIIQKIFGTEALMKGFGIETSAADIAASGLKSDGATVANLLHNIGTNATPTYHSWETFERERSENIALQEEDLLQQIGKILENIAATVQASSSMKDSSSFDTMLNDLDSQLDEAIQIAERFLAQHPLEEASSPESRETRQYLHEVKDMALQLTEGLGAMRTAVPHDMGENSEAQKAGLEEQYRKALEERALEDLHTIEIDPDDALPASEQSLLDEYGPEASFLYFPVWDVTLEVVNTYRCSVGFSVNGKARELRHMMPANTPVQMLERMDLITAQKTLADIKEASSSDIVCAFNVTLHLSLIQSPRSRATLAHMFRALSARERKLLIIEITDIPVGTWASRISECVAFLKQFCRAVLVRIPSQFTGYDELKQAGVNAVGFHMPALNGSEVARLQELERLVINAEKHGLATFISGVDQVSIAANAVGTGVRYIDGSSVGTPLDMPWGILPFALESIYSRLITS